MLEKLRPAAKPTRPKLSIRFAETEEVRV
jgi:hypothetical protein